MRSCWRRHLASQWDHQVLPISSFSNVLKPFDRTLCRDYKSGLEVPDLLNALAAMLDDIMTFLTDQLQMSHQREDYRKLLELALIFTGGIPAHGLMFRKSGAIHRARFMARLIYALKKHIFRDSGFKMRAANCEVWANNVSLHQTMAPLSSANCITCQ